MKLIIKILTGLTIMSNFSSCGSNNILEEILYKGNEKISRVVDNKEKYELQIIYSRVIRKDQNVEFKTYTFNERPNKYFYPASTVKFPAAVLSLEKLNEIGTEGVDKYSHLSIDSLYEGHVSLPKEFMTECGYPNIADYIKQIFIVSDNDAFNRLYDFLGQKELNARLTQRGFRNTKIIHRLSVARTAKQNMETNPINFFNNEGEKIYSQPARSESADISLDLYDTDKGKGYYSNGELINEPKDFGQNNYFSLKDQHNFLIRVILPELFPEDQQFNLTLEDHQFLRKYMSMLPKNSDCPKYSNEKYYDGYVKFLMFGDTKNSIPENIKIYSKSGLAYGYLTDNAYIVDEENDIEFFLSATLHVNENQIYNDDNYEYDEVGLPFLGELGKIIYEFEKRN